MMVGGMATIAGGVAAVYVKMATDAGHPEFAGHLLTASVMNAPAALLISKVLVPETEQSETAGASPKDPPRPAVNSIDALCRGASEGMMLSINVIARASVARSPARMPRTRSEGGRLREAIESLVPRF